LIPLHAYGRPLGEIRQPVLGRVCGALDGPDPHESILMLPRIHDRVDVAGFAGVLTCEESADELERYISTSGVPVVYRLSSLDHLEEGDVIALQPNGHIRTLYRINSPHNALFTTDRCNSFCVMCSQPPKPADEDRLEEHLRLIDLMDPRTKELGITGGEPTLLKKGLLRLVERCKERLPQTALHVLSNGRLFYYGSFARHLAEIGHPDLMIGVPLYSDLDDEHDFIVQARGAFDQTLVGLQNLARWGVPVEIRIVLHRYTWKRLPRLAEFIYRNLPFASHVAFMGLEIMGFAVANLREVWIDPYEYRMDLKSSVEYLARRGMNVSIYNHPLCVVPPEVWSYCRQSISDWKNEYLPECTHCRERERCGGFFSSSLSRQRSTHIQAIL
jgi:His-Xaa-Ser system radical SAM maturase HxsC